MADDNFSDVTDDLVQSLFVQINPYNRKVILNVPTDEQVGLFLVESSADPMQRGLLEWFATMREQYVLGPVPDPQPRGREFPDLAPVSGEIDYPVPCPECGHDVLFHDLSHAWDNCDYVSGDDLAAGVQHPCNCGNHMGR